MLGRSPKDLDYVVVNGTEEELINRGLTKIGSNFPIFIDPQTRAEYAFARGESLEEDLKRRDLTINAMAMDEDGKIIDPFDGRRDLKKKILRHVSDHFAEDPLRVLRIARFKAHLPEFEIHPDTLDYLREISQSDAYQNILGERIFTELRLALNCQRPSYFFEVLKSIGGLRPHFKELADLVNVPQNPQYHPEGDCWVHTMLVLDQAARISADPRIRYSALVHDLGKGVTPKKILPKHIGHEETGVKLVQNLSLRLFIPNDWTETAVVVTRFHLRVHRIDEMKASSIVRMFYEMDAFRRSHLIPLLARACEADDMGKLKEHVSQGKKLEAAFEAIRVIDKDALDPKLEGRAYGEALRAARVKKLKEFLSEVDGNHE